ncbi:FHA domain-containing protein, partial [Acinetobacter baumannii]
PAEQVDDSSRTRAHGHAKSAQSLSVRGFRLEVVEGPALGASFESTADRASIGAHESNDLTIADPTVSRFHCEIAMTPEGPRVKDLGSM